MTDEERVRQLAYSIWEAEGRPEGQQQRHWDRALKIVATEQAAGNDADLEEVGEPLDETPILEEDLPLEDDEVGIQENRLPLEDPDGDPAFDEAPFRDDTVVGQDLPVQDRGHPPRWRVPAARGGAATRWPLVKRRTQLRQPTHLKKRVRRQRLKRQMPRQRKKRRQRRRKPTRLRQATPRVKSCF